MSMALTARVATLEAEVKALREIVNVLTAPEPQHKNPNGPRTLCPKYGLVPNYFLHTRSCKGKAPI